MSALLDHTTELIRQVWRFDGPADGMLESYTRAHPKLGARDRAQLGDALYAALRHRLRWEALAEGSGMALPRALALIALGTTAPRPLDQNTSLPPQALNIQLSKDERSWWQRALQAAAHSAPHSATIDGAADPAGADVESTAHSPWAHLPPHAQHNLPRWLWDALLPTLGAGELAALADALNLPAPLDVRVNLLKAKRAVVQQRLLADGITATPTPFSPWGLRLSGKPSLKGIAAFQDGSLDVQDEGSQLLAWLLDARRGEVVVDFCAGAGGKSLAIGAMMRNQGRVYALDNSAHRLEALKPRLVRSGLSIAYPMAIAHEQDERLNRLMGKVDRVLVDAPCSGLGTLRRHPDLKWRQTPESVQDLVQTQTRILDAAQRLLKPGGRLVYATCSLLPAENHGVAEVFSATHPQFEVLPMPDLLRKLSLPPGTPPLHDGPYLQLWPHRHGTDGFFAAAWQLKL